MKLKLPLASFDPDEDVVVPLERYLPNVLLTFTKITPYYFCRPINSVKKNVVSARHNLFPLSASETDEIFFFFFNILAH